MAQQQDTQKRAPIQKPEINQETLVEWSQMTGETGGLAFSPLEVGMIWDSTKEILSIIDFQRYLYFASTKSLNPLLNDIHMEYRTEYSGGGPKMLCVPHLDGVRKMIAPELNGFEQTHGEDERGLFVESSAWRKGRDRPFKAVAYFREFAQKKSSGDLTYIWDTKGYHMTAKCSENLCYKRAFADLTGGAPTEEEVEAHFEPPSAQTSQPASAYTIGEVEPAKAAQSAAPEPKPLPVATQPVKQAAAPVLPKTEPAAQQPAAPAQADPAQAKPKDPGQEEWKRWLGAFVQQGITKTMIDSYIGTYFGVATKAEWPRDYTKLLAAMKALDDFVFENSAQAVMVDPAAAGRACAPIPVTTNTYPGTKSATPAATASDTTATLKTIAFEITEATGFAPQLSQMAAKVAFKQFPETKQFLAFLEKNGMVTAPIGKVQAFLTLAYYDVALAESALARTTATKASMSAYIADIEGQMGLKPGDLMNLEANSTLVLAAAGVQQGARS